MFKKWVGEKGTQGEKQGTTLRQIPGTIREKNVLEMSPDSLGTEGFIYSLRSDSQEKNAGQYW